VTSHSGSRIVEAIRAQKIYERLILTVDPQQALYLNLGYFDIEPSALAIESWFHPCCRHKQNPLYDVQSSPPEQPEVITPPANKAKRHKCQPCPNTLVIIAILAALAAGVISALAYVRVRSQQIAAGEFFMRS